MKGGFLILEESISRDGVKGLVKSLGGRLVFLAQLHKLTLRDVVPVVTFHRVSKGRPGDSLTCSLADFRSFCRFFADHFKVVPLNRVVQMLSNREPFTRELAITFDDGYRDNFELAAPVLKELHLPATFFVTTDFIGSEIVPWWDEKQGIRFPWMTWDEVRALHVMEFEIGSHTCTHVDLGKVSATDAWNELSNSRAKLEHQLSAPISLFAYPYGRQDNISEENRALVKTAGYNSCFSCFGGMSSRGDDPYFMLRIPISSWIRSPYFLGFELALRRL